MKRRLNYYHFFVRYVACLLPVLAFFVAAGVLAALGLQDRRAGLDPYSYFTFLLFASVVWGLAAEFYKVTSVQELFHERTGIRAASAAWSVTSALLLGVLFFVHRFAGFPRLFLAFSLANLLVLTLAMRALFRALVHRHTGLLWKPHRILMIGADRFARRCAHKLVQGPLSFCQVAAYVSLPGQAVAVKNAPVYSLPQVADNYRELEVDEVLLALPPHRYSEGPGIMKVVERFALPVRAIVEFGDHILVRDRLFQVGRLQILDLTATPAESIRYTVLKRVFDIAFSLFAVALTAPLMALITAAIRLTSAGPVIFVQERVGLNGRIFRMYKFRTMRMAPPAEADTRWTIANDPRRTPLGTFLRKTSLDELPQFFNVLKGDMSVVGPRPERPRFVDKFVNEVVRYNYRHLLKAGITGWAQVNGWRGDTSIRKRIEHDVYYLRNWSLAFDLRIILRTISSLYRSKNAY
ncbi:MAG TPA: exopolysaccharide biosynthesis polyprenyl glycosylphosphotransferase [Terriglobales bacterium]|nr:exopolysaccharide biosynthesis polyprenyl glycosylphosphotransferase [Terriglobales bacterium]